MIYINNDHKEFIKKYMDCSYKNKNLLSDITSVQVQFRVWSITGDHSHNVESFLH
jgi:hypothetical protein